MPNSADLTIEQLALRSGVTTRNIRAYQTKGLLPPPIVRPGGRIGYYGATHQARLRLISQLQDNGHSLAGVASLLEAWESGHTLDQMLGLGEVVEEARPVATQFIPRDMISRLLPKPLTGRRWIAALVHAGVLVRREGGYELRHPSVVDFAIESIRAGVPAQVLLDELPRVTTGLGVIAERFMGHYRRFVAEPYFDAGMPMDRLPEMQARLRQLHELSQKFLASMMCEALDREIEALARRLLAERASS